MTQTTSTKMNAQSLRYALARRFSLRQDKASDEAIDQGFRAAVRLQGTNLWVLMLAIVIASLGLNVNSTAVIIGAMLISPLMGPIMGVGYGMAIHDFGLVRTALKNLGVAVLISVAASTIYFLITPLKSAQSELLARTMPTIWDVLIALFGGLAGTIGSTRKEKSNIIPGVAIATALMPPLCTAGFGLATANWKYFLGAFYLFTINGVFIAIAVFFIVQALHVRQREFSDISVSRRVNRYVWFVSILTILPSLYLAWVLVQDELFRVRANEFVVREIASEKVFVTEKVLHIGERTIEVTIVGDVIAQDRLNILQTQLANSGLYGVKLRINQPSQQKIDVGALREGVVAELYAKNRQELDEQKKINASLQQQLNERLRSQEMLLQIAAEVKILFAEVHAVILTETLFTIGEGQDGIQPMVVANVEARRFMPEQNRERLQTWLLARTRAKKVKLIVDVFANESSKVKK